MSKTKQHMMNCDDPNCFFCRSSDYPKEEIGMVDYIERVRYDDSITSKEIVKFVILQWSEIKGILRKIKSIQDDSF